MRRIRLIVLSTGTILALMVTACGNNGPLPETTEPTVKLIDAEVTVEGFIRASNAEVENIFIYENGVEIPISSEAMIEGADDIVSLGIIIDGEVRSYFHFHLL